MSKLPEGREALRNPTVWIVHEDQLKIYNEGKVVAAIPDHQFLKIIARLSSYLDYRD
jgi:hypothetical protein